MSDDTLQKREPTALDRMRSATNRVNEGLAVMAELLSRQDLTPGQAAYAYRTINYEWKKPIEDMVKATREGLLDRVQAEGKQLDPFKQSLRTKYGGRHYTLTRQVQRHREPDETLLRALLKRKKISADQAFSKVATEVMDPSKIQALLQGGKLTQTELDACRTEKATQLVVEPE